MWRFGPNWAAALCSLCLSCIAQPWSLQKTLQVVHAVSTSTLTSVYEVVKARPCRRSVQLGRWCSLKQAFTTHYIHKVCQWKTACFSRHAGPCPGPGLPGNLMGSWLWLEENFMQRQRDASKNILQDVLSSSTQCQLVELSRTFITSVNSKPTFISRHE